MRKKIIFMTFAVIAMLLFSTSTASAKVMWGKTELKQGQIGKVTILTNINATKLQGSTFTQDKRLKKGEEYRVYTYRVFNGTGYYGLGGSLFVKKSDRIKYETPSKAKLGQLVEEQVINLINAERKQYGLNALTFDGKVTQVARAKSTDMKNHTGLSLYSPTFGQPDEMLNRFGVNYNYWSVLLGSNYTKAEDVVHGWATDYELREHLLNPYHTHIGVAYERDGHYWSAFFVGR